MLFTGRAVIGGAWPWLEWQVVGVLTAVVVDQAQTIHVFAAGTGDADDGVAIGGQWVAGFVSSSAADPLAFVRTFGVEVDVRGVDLPIEEFKAVEAIATAGFDGGDGVTFPGLDASGGAIFDAMALAGDASVGGLKNGTHAADDGMSGPLAGPDDEADEEAALGEDFEKASAAPAADLSRVLGGGTLRGGDEG